MTLRSFWRMTPLGTVEELALTAEPLYSFHRPALTVIVWRHRIAIERMTVWVKKTVRVQGDTALHVFHKIPGKERIDIPTHLITRVFLKASTRQLIIEADGKTTVLQVGVPEADAQSLRDAIVNAAMHSGAQLADNQLPEWANLLFGPHLA